MQFLIITHVPHTLHESQYFAYAPYVNEMNIWIKYVDNLVIVAPLEKRETTTIETAYQHKNIRFLAIENFDLLTWSNRFRAMVTMPKISWQIYKAMQKAEHIHLRCPGNIGLLGCVVQVFFPNKPKTAKYAGNWDPKAKRPWTYTLQKKILQNTFLTKNIQVLIYGEWQGQTKNLKSFFTATYSEKEIVPIAPTMENDFFQFVFVGTLVKGKNPLYTIQLMERLVTEGYQLSLHLYGEGVERTNLEQYIVSRNLSAFISLKGNKSKEGIKQVYQVSDFVILPSDSEGWPKAIAEGMFWGCVPIASSVSCIPFMLDYGTRGLLLEMNLKNDALALSKMLDACASTEEKRNDAVYWSRQYTLERLESEIKTILHP